MLSHSQKNKFLALFLVFNFSISLSTPVFGFYSQFIIPVHKYEEELLKNINNPTDILSALIASGVEPQNYSFYASEIQRWKKEIEESLLNNYTQHQLAQAIGYYLHDNVYTAYKLSSTTLKEIFETGYFNCLSGTILMNILLGSFGIETKSIVLPTHVYTFATLDNRPVEIENTIREGLSISNDKNAQERFNKLTGFNYESTKQQKVVISSEETVGLLYSNRSYFNTKKKEYSQAFQNMLKAQVFLAQTSSEQRNLIAGYLNYSYYIYKKPQAPIQEYLKTLSILEEGISRFPDYKNLKGNYLKGVDIILDKMISSQATTADIDYFVSSSKTFIDPKDYEKLQKIRYIRSSIHYLRTNNNFIEAKKNIKTLWEQNKTDKNTEVLIQEFSYNIVLDSINNPKNLQENPEIVNSLTEFPKNIVQESLGCYYSGLAKNNFNVKKFNNAVQIMIDGKQKIGNTRLIKQNGFVHSVNSAQYFIDNKEYLKAIQFYKYALDFKDDSNVINNLGILYEKTISYYLSANNKNQALKLVQESKLLTPNHPALKDFHRKYS